MVELALVPDVDRGLLGRRLLDRVVIALLQLDVSPAPGRGDHLAGLGVRLAASRAVWLLFAQALVQGLSHIGILEAPGREVARLAAVLVLHHLRGVRLLDAGGRVAVGRRVVPWLVLVAQSLSPDATQCHDAR